MITKPIDTPSRSGSSVSLPVAAATALFAGGLIALNAAGDAVPASDTASLKVIGRCAADVDNSAGAAADLDVVVERGVYRFANSTTDTLTKADVGTAAIVEDDETVGDGTTPAQGIVAGLIVAIDADGAWIDTSRAAELQSQATLDARVVVLENV